MGVYTWVVWIGRPEGGISVRYTAIESGRTINNAVKGTVGGGDGKMSSRRIDRSDSALKYLGRVLGDKNETGNIRAADNIALDLQNISIDQKGILRGG